MRKEKGFTLIELLVVIGVIAILMGIIMPVLGRAREQARKVVCTAHMRGLGLSMRLYADDNRGKLHNAPNNGLWDNAWEGLPIVRPYGANENYSYWGIAYYPYAKNKKVFHCPATQRVDDWPEWGWGIGYLKYFKYCSYGVNGYVTWHSSQGEGDPDRYVRIDHDFKHPSEVIAFQDHVEQKLDDNGDMFYIREGEQVNLTQWRNGGTLGNFPFAVQECFRHRRISNTCWLDGHVSGIRETTGEDVEQSWYTGRKQYK